MPRKGRPKLTVYDVSRELNTCCSIPIYHQAELEVRLVIAFKEPERQPRTVVPRERKQILANTRENKAHKVYLQVLDEDCHAFLPFILATLPRACVSFDLGGFSQQHKGRRFRLDLSTETKELLEGIARRQGFIQNPYFKKLIESIFPEGLQAEAANGSGFSHLLGEGGGPQIKALPPRMQQIEYRYSQISINRISVLGDRLFDAVQASAQWKQERKTGGFTTDCLIALIPRSENKDISIILSVGHEKGLELINQLQPKEGSEMDQPTIEHVQMERSIGMQTEKEIEYKCSHIAISRMSVLSNLLFDAVQASAR